MTQTQAHVTLATRLWQGTSETENSFSIRIYLISKIQLVVYHQCCVLIG